MLRLLIAVAIGAELTPYAEANVQIQAKKMQLSLTSVDEEDRELEHFLHMIPSGHVISQGFGHISRVRSDEMQFRIQFSINYEVDSNADGLNTTDDEVDDNADGLTIMVRNLGDEPIEVEHGESSFLWLEPGSHITHLSTVDEGPLEVFNIRDNMKENMAALIIENMEDQSEL